jgi:hypothetical protein
VVVAATMLSAALLNLPSRDQLRKAHTISARCKSEFVDTDVTRSGWSLTALLRISQIPAPNDESITSACQMIASMSAMSSR